MLILMLTLWCVRLLALNDACGRRVALGGLACGCVQPVRAEEASPRTALLEAVERGAPAPVIEALVYKLASTDPSGGRGAEATGAWRLIWSVGTSRFSPLLQLPRPLRPTSDQYLVPGIRNTLSDGVLGPAHLVLSAGARQADYSTIEILPPFELRLEIAHQNFTLVQADSDAQFRQTQARTLAEQLAPRNQYKQLYLETSGKPGDLRISKVVDGDPVIVGATFVHQRL